LARLEPLLLEAEALDLVEIAPRDLRRDVKGRRSSHRAAVQIFNAVKGEFVLADLQTHLAHHGLEGPFQPRRGVRVETDGHIPIHHAVRRALGPLGCPGVTRHLAEQAVKRHRGEGQPDHSGNDQNEGQRDGPIARTAAVRPFSVLTLSHDPPFAQSGRFRTLPPSLTSVTRKKMTTSATRNHAMARERTLCRRSSSSVSRRGKSPGAAGSPCRLRRSSFPSEAKAMLHEKRRKQHEKVEDRIGEELARRAVALRRLSAIETPG